jgi:glycosyltransferase involved in cell wall biosynthesis
MRQMLHELAGDLALGDRVRFVESLDRPEPYLDASDVVVLPFQHERFSSVHLLEAFARGLPAVTTDLGEQAVLIRRGGGGVLVPVGDEAAFSSAMSRLAEDPAERARLSEAARASAREHGIAAAAARLTALYSELAARASHP